MREEFQRHVQALLRATTRTKLKEADAWFTSFRKLGNVANQLCVDIVKDPSSDICLSHRIVAAQNLVWFCKRGDFDIDFSSVADCMGVMLTAGDASLNPVLSQLYLATAAFLCRQALSVPEDYQSGPGVTTNFCDALAAHTDANVVLRVLSSMPELLVSKDLKLKFCINSDRALIVLRTYSRETEGVVRSMDAFVSAALTSPTTCTPEVIADILQCVIQWLDALSDICVAVKAPPAQVQICVVAVISCWLRSDLVSFTLSELLDNRGGKDLYRKACELVVALLGALSTTGAQCADDCTALISTVLERLSQRSNFAVQHFGKTMQDVMTALTETSLSDSADRIIARADDAAQTISEDLEITMEVLGACISVCSSTPAVIREIVLYGINACLLNGVGVLMDALGTLHNIVVNVPMTYMNGGEYLPAPPPRVHAFWGCLVTIKRWSLFVGDRLMTMLHEMLDPYIDFGETGVGVMGRCIQWILQASTLFPEPFLVILQRKEDINNDADQYDIVACGLNGQFDSSFLSQWSSDDGDDLCEFRTAFRNLIRAISTAYADNHFTVILLDWAVGNTISTLSTLSSTKPSWPIEVDTGCVVFKLSRWPIVEAHLHLCTCVSADLRDAAAKDDSWKVRAIRLLDGIYAFKGHKGIMRMGVMIIAEIAPAMLGNVWTDGDLAILHAAFVSTLDTIERFPERHGTQMATRYNSASSLKRDTVISFEQSQQMQTLSFRTKQDHIGAVSLLRLLQKCLVLCFHRGIEASLQSVPLPSFHNIGCELNCLDKNSEIHVISKIRRIFINILLNSTWPSENSTLMTWKSFMLLLEALVHAVVPLKVATNRFQWTGLHVLMRGSSADISSACGTYTGFLNLEHALGIVAMIGVTAAHRMVVVLQLMSEAPDLNYLIARVLDPAFTRANDSINGNTGIIDECVRAVIYDDISKFGDVFFSQLSSGSSLGDAIAHITRAVMLLSEFVQYLSVALTTNLSHFSLSEYPAVIGGFAATAITASIVCLRAAEQVLPQMLRIVAAVCTLHDPSVDTYALCHLYATCIKSIEGQCATTTPLLLGLCKRKHVRLATSPQMQMCQCCTETAPADPQVVVSVQTILSETLALLRWQVEGLDTLLCSTGGVELVGVAADLMKITLRSLVLGPLRLMKDFSQFIDISEQFQVAVSSVLMVAEKVNSSYTQNKNNLSPSKVDAIIVVVFDVFLELLRLCGYTARSVDMDWCVLRRCLADAQKHTIVLNADPALAVGNSEWFAVFFTSHECPLPALPNLLGPNGMTPEQLSRAIAFASRVVMLVLNASVNASQVVDVSDRCVLVSGFNFLVAALGPVSITVSVVSTANNGSHWVGETSVLAIDEDGQFVASMEKNLTVSSPSSCFGVLKSHSPCGFLSEDPTVARSRKKQLKETDVSQLKPKATPSGDSAMTKWFVECGVLVNELIRVVLHTLSCSKMKSGLLSSREKEAFSRFCMKLVAVFGRHAVSAAAEQFVTTCTNQGASESYLLVLHLWLTAVDAADWKKISNVIKNGIK